MERAAAGGREARPVPVDREGLDVWTLASLLEGPARRASRRLAPISAAVYVTPHHQYRPR
ncbi:MAG: hypothetical protein IPI49_23315 [Myxococcales bacterium]|nr:hypothetical protein [Myxococcales bacterium]